jgi:hypothetical protein
MAIHIPPRVMVFISIPNRYNTITVPNNDKGMASSEMTVERMLVRKRNNTRITQTAPSTRELPTLFTDACI